MSDDKKLQQSVCDELAWEPKVTAAHIGVVADNGVVTLSGHVENFVEKYSAEMAAGRVKGVKAVVEEIKVRLPDHLDRGDDDIAAAAVHRLAWHATIPRDAVMVKVEKGWVTLTGELDGHYQKEATEQEIRGLLGIVGISNYITIKPQISTSDVSDNIMHALHRSYFIDPATVSVSATGGKIRLTGTVRSWHDRRVATDTAWAAPGVTSVVNELAVV